MCVCTCAHVCVGLGVPMRVFVCVCVCECVSVCICVWSVPCQTVVTGKDTDAAPQVFSQGPQCCLSPSLGRVWDARAPGAVQPALGCHGAMGDSSVGLLWQHWSNRRRARARGRVMTIFTFPETASCSNNLPQLGSLPRQEAAVTAAVVGASSSGAVLDAALQLRVDPHLLSPTALLSHR